MFIEQPPKILRVLFPALWRKKVEGKKIVYLTFDDGPSQYATREVLDTLAKQAVKATFFCVGDNVRKNPEILSEVLRNGHTVGCHTMYHRKGWSCSTDEYVKDVQKAAELIDSHLFRPPYGRITWRQSRRLRKMGYKIVMWDVLSRDYDSSLNPDDVFAIVKKYVRDGSIIVFHDSFKARENVLAVLEPLIEWLKGEGYEFGVVR